VVSPYVIERPVVEKAVNLMPDLSVTLRLVEMMCARLCHDLGGLIGTVGNAIDIVAADDGRDNEVLAFASSAARMLGQRLRLLRAAWGPETDAIRLPALIHLVTPPLAARRIDLDTASLPPDCLFAPSVARVVLNLLVLASDSLPRGGRIALQGDPSDLLIRIDGQDAAWPDGFASCMGDEVTAFGALEGARSAQMPLTVLMARGSSLRLSMMPRLSSGVQAVRLSPG
jgi:histidine phosphotransferase ChpT